MTATLFCPSLKFARDVASYLLTFGTNFSVNCTGEGPVISVAPELVGTLQEAKLYATSRSMS